MSSFTALGTDIVCESSSHNVVPLAPNVCITPAAPSPLPLPYPITGTSSQLDPKTENTFYKDKGILNYKSKVAKMHGNEPGTQKDILTFQTTGAAYGLPVPAVTVQFEGGPVIVTGSPGFGNTMP